MATIMAQQVRKFVWKLICWFGLPRMIVTNNGQQFIDKKLSEFYKGLGIKHMTSSMEHPKTNGQVEERKKSHHRTEEKAWR